MISVIYGAKGTGKTKRIIDATNAAASSATGQIVYITDNAQSLGIDPSVKFINLVEANVVSEAEFIGFLKGMLAADFDIQKVFIDGLCRLLALNAEQLAPVFDTMSKVADHVDFVVTVSTDKLPAYLKPYAVND